MQRNSTMDPDSPTDKHNSHVDEKRVQTKDVSLDETNLRHADVDNILHFLGSTGRYQKVQIILLMICGTCINLPMLNAIFIGKFVNFRCAETSGTESSTNASWLSPNQTRKLLDCRVEVKDNVTSRVIGQESCETYQYDGGDQFVSYLAEWDLVCDKEVLGQLPQILLVVGEGLGSALIPPLGDRFGRRRVVIGVVLVEFLLMLVSAFVQQFEVFLLLRLLIGACIQGGCIPVNSMVVELSRTKLRPRVALYQTISWLVVLFINGIAGYLLKDSDWRMLQLTYALIGGVPCIVAIFFLDESLRWLVGNSRVRESEAILRKACRWNSRDYHALREAVISDMKSLPEKPKELKADKEETDVVERCKPLDVLKNKNARKITLVMCFTWFISSLTYYANFLMSTSLAGDPYVNYFLMVTIDMPTGLLCYYSLKRLDRKPSIIGFQLVSAIAMFMAVLVANVAPSENAFSILQTCLTLVGQFFVSTIFVMVWMYTPELFPINLRNFGVGVASTSARVGSSCSPLFTLLARKVPWMPGAMFGGGCLVSAFLLTTLPETRGVPLPVTLDDVDNMSKKKKEESPTVPVTDTDTGRGHDDNCLRHEENV